MGTGIGGMAFAFYVMLPTALPFLFNFMGLTTQPRPSSYYNFVTLIMFWLGITFEFPLVIYLLANLGFIKAKNLITQWKCHLREELLVLWLPLLFRLLLLRWAELLLLLDWLR